MKQTGIFTRLWLFVLVNFFSLVVNAQQIDSIESVIQHLISYSSESDQKELTRNFADSITVIQLLDLAYDNSRGNPDTAIILLNDAISMSLNSKSLNYVSKSMERLGHYYYFNEEYSLAARCYLLSLKIEEKFGEEISVAKIELNLGRAYNYLELLQNALDYTYKALAKYEKNNITDKTAEAYENLGLLYFNRNFWELPKPDQRKTNHDEALKYYNKALGLISKTDDELHKAKILQSIAAVYNQNGNSEKALVNILESLRIYKKYNENARAGDALYAIGVTYKQLGKPKEAIGYLNEALELGKKNNLGGVHWLYETLAEANYDAGNYKQSRDLYVRFINTRDSVLNLEKAKMILDLENKYQAEKKQNEIDRLTLIKKQRTLVIYTLIAVLLLILVAGFAFFKNIRAKKIIADQQLEIREKQLLELEKEKQLIATRSLLAGEEIERTRLAGDLHDGLGGLLTGVKLKLSSMKENSIITSENLAYFNHALNLLDTSIAEMRRVAHNLMPETLMHYGLQTAIADFIRQVEPEGLPVIRFNSFGNDLRYGKDIEITIYRIIQELVNNSLKHAEAKNIEVQFFTEPDRVSVQIVDDGKGFNTENNDKELQGKGLKNISDRITAFNGHFEIISEPGKGTECTLEFLIT
jgi:signal transduction histidine kinase